MGPISRGRYAHATPFGESPGKPGSTLVRSLSSYRTLKVYLEDDLDLSGATVRIHQNLFFCLPTIGVCAED